MFNLSISFVEMPGKDVFDALRTSVVEMKMWCVFWYVNMEMYIKNIRWSIYLQSTLKRRVKISMLFFKSFWGVGCATFLKFGVFFKYFFTKVNYELYSDYIFKHDII